MLFRNTPYCCSNVKKIILIINLKMRYSYLSYILLICFISSCGNSMKQEVHAIDTGNEHPLYAKGFSIINEKSLHILEIYSPWKEGEILNRYVIWPDSVALPDSLQSQHVIFTPVKRLVTLSSTQWAAALKLNHQEELKGVSEAGYIQTKAIRNRLNKGETIDVAANGSYKTELIVQMKPDLILYSPDPSGIPDVLSRLNVPLLAWPDYYENHPLGRAEWIKVMGLLLEEEKQSNALFIQISIAYENLAKLTKKLTVLPTIFADKEFSGQWYVPGGKSYMACLFKDAGADYIWAENQSTASFPLDIETILNKANHADFWRIAEAANKGYSYDDLRLENEIYTSFKAFKEKKIIFCNTAQTAYFEKSQFEPDVVLCDLISILHPGLLPGYQPVYYHLLQ